MDLTVNIEKVLRTTEDDIVKALKHYGLSEKATEEAMNSLKEWYRLQPHLPQGQMCDRKFIRHFISSGCSIEKTKRNIDCYFSARNLTPEFTSNRDPMSKSIEQVFENCIIATFPQLTESQHRVTFMRLRHPDTSTWDPVEAFKTAFMIGDYRLMNDAAIGDHFIVQFDHVRMGHLVHFTPVFVTKSLYYLQSCIAAKIKGIHLVGLPPYAEAIVAMFKRALSKKMADRFYTYSSLEELTKLFPREIIPKDLGGQEISTDEITENLKETFQSPPWRKWFIEQENVKTDESKRDRTKSEFSPENIAGVHGSFRKLDVD